MPESHEEHVWVAAATVDLDVRQARRAVMRHTVRVATEARIDVLDVYCRECRRTWDDVVDEPCIAATATDHLRGGPIRPDGRQQRKKRPRHHLHDCALLGCDASEPSTGEISAAG